LTLLENAGYDLSQSPRAIELLSESYPADSSFGPYRSHPDEEERVELLQETIQANFSDSDSGGLLREEAFSTIRPHVVEIGIQLRLASRQYQLALKDMGRAETYYEGAPLLNYYKGEVYRGIGDHPFDAAQDQAWMETGKKAKSILVAEYKENSEENYKKALEFYEKALSAKPDLLVVYRGIGYIAYAQGENEKAISSFETYLTLDEHLDDRLYVERLLRELTEESI
jgi:tetratricopeptide (TPR) repeat protein